MKNIQAKAILGSLLLCLPVASLADFSGLPGIWDLDSEVAVHVGGKAFHGDSTDSRLNTVQFKEDGGYTILPWSPVPGTWTDKPNGKYKITLDLDQVNAGQTTPVFLNTLVNQFKKLAKNKFGQDVTINELTVVAAKDKGKLFDANQGTVKGGGKLNAKLVFVNPANSKTETAKVKLTATYTGTRASAPSACCTSDDPAQNLADSQSFLADNGTLPGIRTTASGLQYKVLSQGTGDRPKATDTVIVNYRGILPAGETFDANSGARFQISNVIAGFAEGLQLMPVNAYYRLYIPPELAYGEAGSGSDIKPNSALIFDVQLVKIANANE